MTGGGGILRVSVPCERKARVGACARPDRVLPETPGRSLAMTRVHGGNLGTGLYVFRGSRTRLSRESHSSRLGKGWGLSRSLVGLRSRPGPSVMSSLRSEGACAGLARSVVREEGTRDVRSPALVPRRTTNDPHLTLLFPLDVCGGYDAPPIL